VVAQASGHARGEDAQAGPFGDVFGHRFVEGDLALLDQHHEGHRGDRLGHRIDAKERVRLQRRAPLAVGQAQDRVIGQLAAPPDLHLGAGQLARLDVALIEKRRDPRQAFGGKAQALGFGHGLISLRTSSQYRTVGMPQLKLYQG